MRASHWLAVGLLAGGAAACKLYEETTAPPGTPVIVVQAVLQAGSPGQQVLVERSSDGTTPPGGSGITGATVTLTHLNPGDLCPAPVVQLGRDINSSSLPGSYAGGWGCALLPGDRAALRVETPDGGVVTGTTRIPGARSVSVRVGGQGGVFPVQGLLVDRTRDTLRIDVDPIFGRALQVSIQRWTSIGSIAYDITSDTFRTAVPGSLVNPFDDGRSVLRAGGYYLLTVAVADTNYFDFVRSRANPLTGSGFLNHLAGGIGVFGSVSAFTVALTVTAPLRDPREGLYQIRGHLGATVVDATWKVYLDPNAAETANLSAFVDGTWAGGVIHDSFDGGLLKSGSLSGRLFAISADSSLHGLVPYAFTGTRAAPGVPFEVLVTYPVAGRSASGTLTAVQVSGPP